MTQLGIDYAWRHPSPSAIKSDGYSFVLRYLSADPTKNLTVAEAKSLLAAGLSIGLVWETTATRATAGYAAGRADRVEAEKQANALGYPTYAVIFWACDEQAPPSAVLPYAQGWFEAGTKTRPTGPYGDQAVIEAVHAAGYSSVEWQTEAWSGTAVSGQADLYQRVKTTRPSLGGGYDEDVMFHAVRLWAPYVPKPAPVFVYRRVLRKWMVGNDVSQLKARLRYLGYGGTVPGPMFGRGVEQSVKNFQHNHKLTVDGVVGPITAKAINA